MITAILGAVFFFVALAAIAIAWGANNRRRAGQAGLDAVADQPAQRPQVRPAEAHK